MDISILFTPAILLILVPLAFAVTGGYFAFARGKNPVLWGVLSAVFPLFIMITWFEKPKKAVKGHFKQCQSCDEWIKWAETPCHYCGAEQKTLNQYT